MDEGDECGWTDRDIKLTKLLRRKMTKSLSQEVEHSLVRSWSVEYCPLVGRRELLGLGRL